MEKMATPGRRTKTPVTRASPLNEQVFAEGYEFDFSQIVAILEALHPNAIALGEGTNPRQEALRISSRTVWGVSASEVQEITYSPQKPPQVRVNFLGIAGVHGSLPPSLTEEIIDRLRAKDTCLQDFLDIFNHRLASLWYRGHKKMIPGTEKINPTESSIGLSLLDLIGLFTPELRHQGKIEDRSLLRFAGLLWKKPRSVMGLEQLLQSYFELPIRIQQFIGKWQRGTTEHQTKIGAQQGYYHRLGQETVLGNKSWDQTDGITIVIGPVSWDYFLNFLPGKDSYALIKNWLTIYCGNLLSKHIRILLKPRQIQLLPLGQRAQLGYTTWLKSSPDSPAFKTVRCVSFR